MEKCNSVSIKKPSGFFCNEYNVANDLVASWMMMSSTRQPALLVLTTRFEVSAGLAELPYLTLLSATSTQSSPFPSSRSDPAFFLIMSTPTPQSLEELRATASSSLASDSAQRVRKAWVVKSLLSLLAFPSEQIGAKTAELVSSLVSKEKIKTVRIPLPPIVEEARY